VNGKILADGSLHSFVKSAHLMGMEHIDNFFKSRDIVDVTTPTYPFKQQKLPEILEYFSQYDTVNDSCILMYADSVRSAELNMLFQYYKISIGLDYGLDIFCNNSNHDIALWDSNYTHWKQMKVWQLREWISLFYEPWVHEWIDSAQQVGHRFLTVKNTDLLFDPIETVKRIFKHCNLTQKPELDIFLYQWQQAQQYIVNEFNLLDQIIDHTIAGQTLEWKPINIISEAIIQQRLRAKGYEIRCDGLDIFPTDAIMFNSLLEKVHK
jgi:hypothetical protein